MHGPSRSRHLFTTITLLLVLLLVAAASARPGGFGRRATQPTGDTLDEILLTDGTLLRGTILAIDPESVTIETEGLGKLVIPRTSITRIARRGERSGAVTDPDYNSLMFCPTPATLERGDAYFRDFELFFLNFGGGITDALDVSVGTFFPVSSDLLMISLGAKLRLLDRETGPVGIALVGNLTIFEEVRFGGPGIVIGVGDRRSSFNLAVNRVFDDDGDTETVVLAGADLQGARRMKVFAEYMNSSSLIDDDDDFNGLVNVGLRLFGRRHSFSLSGLRPLSEDTGSFIAFPMVSYSMHW